VKGQPFWSGGTEAVADARLADEICEAYRKDGARFVERLHGSFALAILDPQAGRAVLAIDRMGIGRLAYSSQGDRLVVSSSAEAVARTLCATPALDRQAIFSYLFFHMVPSPATIFAGVHKLPPATVAEFDNGRLSVRRYWEPIFAEEGPGDFDALKTQLFSSLREAVRATHPQADSGAFLSGGLDSSTVAGLLAEAVAGKAQTFSIGFGFEGYDELQYARIANQRFACEGHEYSIQAEDIVAAFASIARAYDEPFGNSSALPAYYCAQLARRHGVSHLLAGDGGDEIFAGNSRYAKQSRYEIYQKLPAGLREIAFEPFLELAARGTGSRLLSRASTFVSRARRPLPDRLEIWNPLCQVPFEEALEDAFLQRIDHDAPFQHMRDVYSSMPAKSTLIRMLRYDWRFTLADNDLRKVEAMCEIADVRVSYPMLHPDVVEMAGHVPPQMMMQGGELRSFYKRAMAGFLPGEIIQKQKHGFGLPFGLWLRHSPRLRELMLDNLDSLRNRGIVRREYIDSLLTLHGEHDADYHGVFVWVLAMLEQWFKEHQVTP
jgi:asparagine synthase (glutamine-hydrolysing)